MSISKKYQNFTQMIFLLTFLINLVNSQKYTKESMEVHPVLGLGAGTLAVIIAIVLGVIVMIFGLAFPSPGLFVFIGILIPLVVFIFVIVCPRQTEKQVESWENDHKNYYIIARWLYFLLMIILFFGLLAPAFAKWNITIIPQRVDSSSQKDFYDEKYMEAIEKQKKRKYNMEETDYLLNQRLPLGINKRGLNLNRNIQNNHSSSLIQNNSQNNISNNLIDNTNLDNNNEFPRPILPSTTKRNEFMENKKKFKGFKRKKDQ